MQGYNDSDGMAILGHSPTLPFSQTLRKLSDSSHICHLYKGAEPLKENIFGSVNASVFFQPIIRCSGLDRQLHANLLGARRFIYYIQPHREDQ